MNNASTNFRFRCISNRTSVWQRLCHRYNVLSHRRSWTAAAAAKQACSSLAPPATAAAAATAAARNVNIVIAGWTLASTAFAAVKSTVHYTGSTWRPYESVIRISACCHNKSEAEISRVSCPTIDLSEHRFISPLLQATKLIFMSIVAMRAIVSRWLFSAGYKLRRLHLLFISTRGTYDC